MEFKDLLKALSEHLGGGVNLTPHDGTVDLSVDDMHLSVTGSDETSSVSFVGIVGELPPGKRSERLFKALLEANHLFAGTGGATFSINGKDGVITLNRSLSYDMLTGETFCEALTLFVNTLESWIRLVADYRAAQDSSDDVRDDKLTAGNGFMAV